MLFLISQGINNMPCREITVQTFSIGGIYFLQCDGISITITGRQRPDLVSAFCSLSGYIPTDNAFNIINFHWAVNCRKKVLILARPI